MNKVVCLKMRDFMIIDHITTLGYARLFYKSFHAHFLYISHDHHH